MADTEKARRFVYQTRGVCPPEIHFRLNGENLEGLRFVGGGCPGNAQLAARLLEGRPTAEALTFLEGIQCRNNTSCSDQLATAITAAESGRLSPADSFRVYADPSPGRVIGLIGELGGHGRALEELLDRMENSGVERIYSVGNLTGNSQKSRELITLARKREIPAILGQADWQCALGADGEDASDLTRREKDWLVRQPHVVTFEKEGRTGMAFYGEYLQDLPGFSDFDPFALEMNMVCGMTDFMRDETVFPALEAMVPQFKAGIVIFSQTREWGHWNVAGTDFISLGPAVDERGLAWGRLEVDAGKISFKKVRAD
ncbi:MAG: TSCPD domain-containing protein [Desulfobacterales bacterium]|nr:TSCPD domain-containing protein [Desulfobacterales bacterium]